MTGARVLVAAPIFPWPADTGARMRVAQLVRALAEMGSVDLLVMAGANQTTPCEVPDGAPVDRVKVVPRPAGRSVGLHRLAWAVRGGLPVDLAALDFGPLRSEVAAWLAPSYAGAWIFMPELFVALRPVLQDPLVVDLFDLEDQKHLRRLALADAGRSPAIRLRQAAARLQGRRNAGLWRDLHARIGREAALVTVCSEQDHRLLGQPGAAVLPNGYELDGLPLGREEVGRPPTVLLQGSMVYAPNADGARVLAQDIAPLLRRRLPDAAVRIVGRHLDAVARLHDPPAVTVTGHVADLSAELRGADLVAVPLRYGSGTRVKILEAFAHRIPVVSTPVGAEGLDVVDGTHLLLRPPGESFAEACAQALTDDDLRRRLTDHGHALFRERYQWSDLRARAVELARAAFR